MAEGDLSPNSSGNSFPDERVDYDTVAKSKMELLYQAGTEFLSHTETPRTFEFGHFCNTTPWLHDFALFMALKRHYNGHSWNLWPREASHPTPEMRLELSKDLDHEITVQKYMQWQFSRQWQELRSYANERGIAVIGDIPTFVAYDSADVWSHHEFFLLDSQRNPTVVAGVPPDYFSSTGQL